jgi:hypothetical protein
VSSVSESSKAEVSFLVPALQNFPEKMTLEEHFPYLVLSDIFYEIISVKPEALIDLGTGLRPKALRIVRNLQALVMGFHSFR